MPPFELPDAVSQPTSQIPDNPTLAGAPQTTIPPSPGSQDSLPTTGAPASGGAPALPDSGPPTYQAMATESPPGIGPDLNFGLPPGLVPASLSPAPAQAPPTQAPPAVPLPSDAALKSALEEAGIDVSRFESPKHAFDLLLEMANEARQATPYIQIGQQAASDWDAYQRWKQSQTPIAPQPQAAATPPVEQPADQWQWEAPPFNPRWLEQIDQESGQLKPGADPTILSKIMDYQHWLQNTQQQFWNNPAELIGKAVAPKLSEINKTVEQRIEQRVKAEIEAYHAKQEADRVAKEEQTRFESARDKLFRKNSQGQYLRDPVTGQFSLTKQGEFFQQRMAEAQRYRMDERTATQYAYDRLSEAEQSGAFGNGQPPAPPSPPPAPQSPAPEQRTPAQIHAENRQSFMDEALAAQRLAGQRDGTIPDAATEPPRQPLGRPRTAQELVAETIASLG